MEWGRVFWIDGSTDRRMDKQAVVGWIQTYRETIKPADRGECNVKTKIKKKENIIFCRLGSWQHQSFSLCLG